MATLLEFQGICRGCMQFCNDLGHSYRFARDAGALTTAFVFNVHISRFSPPRCWGRVGVKLGLMAKAGKRA
jgi:hypothetical protein